MKLKLDANGNAVLQDGKPVYVADDGKELVFDAPQMYGKITSLTQEAAGHRTKREEAEAKLAGFQGIEDPAAAINALKLIKNLDDKKLVDAGEVQRVKDEVSKVYEGRLAESDKRVKTLEGTLYDAVIGGVFARSKFIAEKVAVPADLIQAKFGSQFGIDDGKPYAVDANGQKIFSRVNPGNLADPDEALEIIIGAYPYKDQLLKGTGASGGGSHGGNGQGAGGNKTTTRAAFDSMSPLEQARAAKETTIVD